MCCYAGKLLQQAMHNPTLLIVTDRNDLMDSSLKPLAMLKNY
jgi:type I site-specific restriction-modification system R (restriction) subunit